jgi:hypothetical protein
MSHEIHLTRIHKCSVHLSESSQRMVMKNFASTYACRRKGRRNIEQAFVIIWRQTRIYSYRISVHLNILCFEETRRQRTFYVLCRPNTEHVETETYVIWTGNKLLLAVLIKFMTASLEIFTQINRLKPNGNCTDHLL